MTTTPIPSAATPSVLRPATGTVFHYTGPSGLLGIVQGRSLWASEASSLNDVEEVEQGWALVKRLLASKPASKARDELLDVPDWARRPPHEVFVLCGSTQAEDVNQWWTYAENGIGYALGLDACRPLAVLSGAAEPGADHQVQQGASSIPLDFSGTVFVSPWRHVVYSVEQVSAALDELIAEVPVLQERVRRAPTKEDSDVENQLEWGRLWQSLEEIAQLYKPAGFAGEHEVRTIVTAIEPAAHVSFRNGRTGIVSYLSLTGSPSPGRNLLRRLPGESAQRRGTLPLVGVRIGPRLPKGHEETIRLFLDTHDMEEVTVERSELALR